jgi:predicted chitinase/peptidoglycan hydrolase-like protein with peptidoglycan-binding domain
MSTAVSQRIISLDAAKALLPTITDQAVHDQLDAAIRSSTSGIVKIQPSWLQSAKPGAVDAIQRAHGGQSIFLDWVPPGANGAVTTPVLTAPPPPANGAVTRPVLTAPPPPTAAVPPPRPGPVLSPGPVAGPGPALPDAAKSPVDFFRALADSGQTLKLGDRGVNVAALQNALNAAHATQTPLQPDGKYGPAVQAAVKAYASKVGSAAADGTSLPADAARGLAEDLERPSALAAGGRLFNAFSVVGPNRLHAPVFEEASQRLRDAAAETDDGKRAQDMKALFDKVQSAAGEIDPAKMAAADPTWQQDLAALRNHFDQAAKAPGGVEVETLAVQNGLAQVNNQRLDAAVKAVSAELLKQSPQTQQQFNTLLDALTAPGANKSPQFQSNLQALGEFLLGHGGENKKAMAPETRRAWDELEAALLTTRDALKQSGGKTDAVSPLIDFLNSKYVGDTQALITADPKNPGIPNLPKELTDRISKLQAAADANKNPLVTAEMIQRLTVDAGYKPLTQAKAQAMADGLEQSMEMAKITTAHERAAFLAQCVAETGGFNTFQEEDGGNPHYFDRYDNNTGIGNRGHPDGATFHGRGPVQLTGRDNYTRFSRWMNDGDQVMKNPDLVATDPKYSFASAGWFWNVNHLNDPANQGNLALVVQRLNGPGMLGWDTRLKVYNDALAIYAKQGTA